LLPFIQTFRCRVWETEGGGMRRRIFLAGGTRAFTGVGLAMILAVMLWSVATAPPTTMVSGAAFAQYGEPDHSGRVTIEPTEGPVGTKVRATGTNWPPGAQIRITWGPKYILTTDVSVDKRGTFRISFRVPPNATEGNHTIYFTNFRRAEDNFFNPKNFKVTKPPPKPNEPAPKPNAADDNVLQRILDFVDRIQKAIVDLFTPPEG
jgi:hypothetical protein